MEIKQKNGVLVGSTRRTAPCRFATAHGIAAGHRRLACYLRSMFNRHASAVALALTMGVAHVAAASQTLPWMEDDYEAARKRAIARHVPLVIEVWAPW